MYDDFDEYEDYDFEDIELYEHKRSDKVKWIISFLLSCCWQGLSAHGPFF